MLNTTSQLRGAKPAGHINQQIRHASLMKRPHRPYTFTQLITLSDGSTYTQRTTSPQPVFKSTKDTRNHVMWQPSMSSLRNVEEDEAGRLRAFRAKFGRGWDVEGTDEEASTDDADNASNEGSMQEKEESLMDLISGFAGANNIPQEKPRPNKSKTSKGKS